jgi:RNA polymerase sigma-54 factor
VLHQNLSQKLQQKLSPQQIQLMKLIQLQTQSLEERIQEEMEVNPALEEALPDRTAEDSASDEESWEADGYDDGEISPVDAPEGEQRDTLDFSDYFDDDTPDYKTQANNHSADDESYETPLVGAKSMQDHLLEQLATVILTPNDETLCKYLIGTLDDDGYLRRATLDICDDLAFSLGVLVEPEDLERLVGRIQSLDPAGIGARNLQECLTLQLERKNPPTPLTRMAHKVVQSGFEALAKRHYAKLLDLLQTDETTLKEVLAEIGRLNPKPGGAVGGSGAVSGEVVIPDFLIHVHDGRLELQLNSRNAPELNISRDYKDMLAHYKDSKGQASAASKEALLFVKQKIDAAKWFIDAIKQRQQTLLLTMSAIMKYQEKYFLSGDERHLKPMILKDIADEVGMDISTVSRVASNKYVQTPFGTFLIKTFFSESMLNSEGEEVSTKEIKKILEDSIGEEDTRHPLTDDALAQLLEDKGYPIARRTVAKYREQLGIPVARLRKTL